MRAIIVGAGAVGYDVARMLSLQRHDVTVIDLDPAKVAHVQDTLDVMALVASGTNADALGEAQIHRADLVVAVTNVDEVNLIACMMAERIRPGCVTIARVRSGDFTEGRSPLRVEDFGLDLIIHPEESAAREAVSLLRRAAATDVIDVAGGRLQLVGVRIAREAPVVGRTLMEIAQEHAHLTFRIMGIARGARTIVPRGDERLQKDDQVFVLIETAQVPQVVHALGKSGTRLDNVMILGGSAIGGRIARHLIERKRRRSSTRIKLVEPDRRRAERLAEQLEGVLVIHGDPADIDLLVIEGIADMDAVVAVTEDEESNLVSCLMAKHLGVGKTIALLSKSAYIPISQSIGLDAAVSQKLAVSREVLRFLRGKHVRSVATVHGLDAEILELEAAAGAAIVGRPLMETALPKGLLIGAVVGPGHSDAGDIEIATGQTVIQAGDRVILFALPDVVGRVEDLFGASAAAA